MQTTDSDLETLNKAREKYEDGDISKTIQLLKLIDAEEIRLLNEEIILSTGNMKYLEHLVTNRPGRILGLIDCPYHPYLNIEYTDFTDLSPSIEIPHRFTNIRCVLQKNCSQGLNNEQVVAIFPENFRSVIPKEEFPVFYFVNKFSSRHLKHTRPLLKNSKLNSIFYSVVNLPQSKLNQLVTNWVNLHEVSHRNGLMPIPKYLEEKSNRYTAALEELSADLHSIKTCLESRIENSSDLNLTAIYILSERLLGYPIFRDKNNFDTISSVIFWKFLKDGRYLDTNNINLNHIHFAIKELIDLIESFEQQALQYNTPELRKNSLRSSVLNFLGNYSLVYEEYKHFWESK